MSDSRKPDDVAPAIVAASRAMIAAMMARVSTRGFDGLTPAFASLIPLLDAAGARPSVLAQQSGVTKQAMSQLVKRARDPRLRRAGRGPDRHARQNRAFDQARRRATRSVLAGEDGDLDARGWRVGKTKLARLKEDLIHLAAALGQPLRK